MKTAIIIRYSEIHLKGKNRSYFEKLLKENIKKSLKGINYSFVIMHSRYLIEDYSEEDFMIVGGTAPNENAKGVIHLSETSEKKFPVLGINITADKRVIEELKKHTKGFFFVRQKRMPLTLA